jgi:hypothetical protein
MMVGLESIVGRTAGVHLDRSMALPPRRRMARQLGRFDYAETGKVMQGWRESVCRLTGCPTFWASRVDLIYSPPIFLKGGIEGAVRVVQTIIP